MNYMHTCNKAILIMVDAIFLKKNLPVFGLQRFYWKICIYVHHGYYRIGFCFCLLF